MNEQKYPSTLTVKDVRNILQIGSNSVYILIHSNAFPVLKIGHSYRIPAESFFSWLEGNHSGAARI